MRFGYAFILATCLSLASCTLRGGHPRGVPSDVPDGPFVHYPSVWETPLHQAAWGESTTILVEKLAEAGQVDARDKQGLTPLMHAVKSGSPTNENSRILIKSGADVNARDNQGLTPLMHAVQSSWRYQEGWTRPPEDTLERVSILLDAGADVNACGKHGETALMLAAGAGGFQAHPDGATCTLLVERGAYIDARDADGLTALMYAARKRAGNIPALLAAHADVNAIDHQGRSALIHASTGTWNDANSVKALVKGKADLEVVDQNGWTALAHAAWNRATNHSAIALLHAGANIEPLGWTPLHAAALERKVVKVHTLLSANSDPNARDKWGRTPLMWAAKFIDRERMSIPLLIRKGAEVNAADESGITALHIAASHAWDDELKDLLSNGAHIDARDLNGQTPLMHAAASPVHDFQLLYLLKSGASVDAIDLQGRTALMHVVISKNFRSQCIEFLMGGGADKQIREATGRTAFDYASDAQSVRVPERVKALLDPQTK